jgi:hypothetical protein
MSTAPSSPGSRRHATGRKRSMGERRRCPCSHPKIRIHATMRLVQALSRVQMREGEVRKSASGRRSKYAQSQDDPHGVLRCSRARRRRSGIGVCELVRERNGTQNRCRAVHRCGGGRSCQILSACPGTHNHMQRRYFRRRISGTRRPWRHGQGGVVVVLIVQFDTSIVCSRRNELPGRKTGFSLLRRPKAHLPKCHLAKPIHAHMLGCSR